MKRFDGRERTNSIPTNVAITGPTMLPSSCHLLVLRLGFVDVNGTVAAAVAVKEDEVSSATGLK